MLLHCLRLRENCYRNWTQENSFNVLPARKIQMASLARYVGDPRRTTPDWLPGLAGPAWPSGLGRMLASGLDPTKSFTRSVFPKLGKVDCFYLEGSYSITEIRGRKPVGPRFPQLPPSGSLGLRSPVPPAPGVQFSKFQISNFLTPISYLQNPKAKIPNQSWDPRPD